MDARVSTQRSSHQVFKVNEVILDSIEGLPHFSKLFHFALHVTSQHIGDYIYELQGLEQKVCEGFYYFSSAAFLLL